MLDEIVSDTERPATPPAIPVIPVAPSAEARSAETRVEPSAVMFGAVPLRKPEQSGGGPRDARAPEIKIQPTEIRERAPRTDKAADDVSTRQGSSVFVRALRFGARTVLVAGLCALAWAAGAYYSSGHSPFAVAKSTPAFVAQPGAGHDDMLAAMHQMTDEMRALKANAAQTATQAASSNAVPVPAGATNADVMSRIDKLDAEFTAKLSQVDQQLASIEQQMAASHAALVARVAAARKHAKLHLHDAFNPAQEPGAPGAPRPLGMQ